MNFAKFRVIVDEFDQSATITSSQTGQTSTLSLSEGLALNPSTLGDANNQLENASFLRRASANGWISDDRSALYGTYRSVPFSPHLKRLQIETTLICNLACGYCYCEASPTQSKSLPIESAIAAVDDAEKLGCIYVDITGGEIFAYKEWLRLATHIRQKGLVLTVHTNGLILDHTRVTSLLQLGAFKVLVSFESHIPEVHNAIRRGTRALERTAKNVAAARDRGLNVSASLMVHKKNKEDIGETIQWLSNDLKIPVNLDRIVPYGREADLNTSDIGLNVSDFYNSISAFVSKRTGSGSIAQTRICDSGGGEISGLVEPHCGVAHSFIFITASGEMALCPTMTSREEQKFKGPLLSETTLYDAWVSHPLFSSFRFLNCSNIKKCPTSQSCGGGCRSNAYSDTGRLDAPDVLECNLHKNTSDDFVDFHKRYEKGQFSFAE